MRPLYGGGHILFVINIKEISIIYFCPTTGRGAIFCGPSILGWWFYIVVGIILLFIESFEIFFFIFVALSHFFSFFPFFYSVILIQACFLLKRFWNLTIPNK